MNTKSKSYVRAALLISLPVCAMLTTAAKHGYEHVCNESAVLNPCSDMGTGVICSGSTVTYGDCEQWSVINQTPPACGRSSGNPIYGNSYVEYTNAPDINLPVTVWVRTPRCPNADCVGDAVVSTYTGAFTDIKPDTQDCIYSDP